MFQWKIIIFIWIGSFILISAQQHQQPQPQPQPQQHNSERLSRPLHPPRERRNESQTRSQNNNLASGAALSDNANDGILNRLNDRLTALVALDEQQLKKLEALEYKITRIEVTNQERIEAIRTELRDLSRRVQNLDWITSKTEGTVDQLSADWNNFKEHLTTHHNAKENRITPSANSGSLEVSEKLNALAVLLTSTRSAVHRVEQELQSTVQNITNLASNVREISVQQRNIPTKQFLNNAILGLKSQPIYAVMQSPPGNGRNVLDNVNSIIDNSQLPMNCKDASKKTGINKINVGGSLKGPFFVNCDNGWTVIQNREEGTVNFYRSWSEYKYGFGNLDGEFWIGLDKLHEITSSKIHELFIQLEDHEGETKVAKYSSFAIGGEKENYALVLLGKYSGDAGDSLSYHAGQKFSTFDLDNDSWPEGNCAQAHTGAWWFNACDTSNLNGRYLGGEVPDEMRYQGIYWNEFKGSNYSLKSVRMMIRPVD